MSKLPLDAREVLLYLNELGYRNITAEQLKEFIKDLKKLIKYEKQLGVFQPPEKQDLSKDRFETLHRTTTISSRAKSAAAIPPKSKTDHQNKENDEIINQPKHIIGSTKCKDKQSNRNTLLTESTKKAETNDNIKPKKSISRGTTAVPPPERPESRMWIRSRSATPSRVQKSDPVQLYHYYQKEWEKFKKRLPGENNHAELRWKIRHNLLGSGR